MMPTSWKTLVLAGQQQSDRTVTAGRARMGKDGIVPPM